MDLAKTTKRIETPQASPLPFEEFEERGDVWGWFSTGEAQVLGDVGRRAHVEPLGEPTVRDVGRFMEMEGDRSLPWRRTMLTNA